MRKAISLIELVFTIVIIAVVFTVIPKIVFALNKSDAFAIKQDALLNGVTLMQMISKLNWDENSTTTNDILKTDSITFFECNTTTHYRKGGFIGSRNCDQFGGIVESLAIGSIDANESTYSLFDDIDDFNIYDKNTSIENNTTKFLYGLHVNVLYLKENAITFNPTTQNVTIDLNQSLEETTTSTTNLKKVMLNIDYQGKRTGDQNQSIAQFSYVSSNIGKAFLNKRTW